MTIYELIVHDKKIRENAIDEYYKKMCETINGNEELGLVTIQEVLEINEIVAEQLKGKKND